MIVSEKDINLLERCSQCVFRYLPFSLLLALSLLQRIYMCTITYICLSEYATFSRSCRLSHLKETFTFNLIYLEN